MERTASSPNDFSTITKGIAMDFEGRRIELRGFLRTKDVTGFVGLWMREDGDSPNLEFDNMQSRAVKGTQDWQEYTISLRVNPDARVLAFGVLIQGTGVLWIDGLQLLVDGKPVWEAPKVKREPTALDTDHEFDHGSGINLDSLNDAQVENLVTLGKVWGFLKYHHPAVTSGRRHWDYDLFRVLPTLLAVKNRPEGNAAFLRWIQSLGPLPECHDCAAAKLEQRDLTMPPPIGWIHDHDRLGAELSRALETVYAHRPATRSQFYLTMIPGVQNPKFEHELSYNGIRLPDAGYQLLAAYRFWNIVDYWSPYRDIIGGDWDDALRKHIRPIALARTRADYERELMALIAELHDTHANLWSSIAVRPPAGACSVPVRIAFVDHHPVVSAFATEDAQTSGLQVGDIIDGIDGVAVSKLIEDWTPYYSDSNVAARERDMAQSLLHGACGTAQLRILRNSEATTATAPRIPSAQIPHEFRHDRPGPAFQRLSNDIGYLKLSAFKTADVPSYLDSAAGTKGLIIDIRNYPSEFAVFSLGQKLITQSTNFARFTIGDLENPGAFHWGVTINLRPQEPHYSGKIVILIDEISQSQAEYTSMALRAAPGAVVVGSMTAGADGNVSNFTLPGGLTSMISGIGVFYPDGKPTQRVGIVPDVEVRPTIQGIRDGRDEVLEAGVRAIVGSEAADEEIRKITRR